MDIIKIAKEFERREHSFKNPSDRIRASHEIKEIILVLTNVSREEADKWLNCFLM